MEKGNMQSKMPPDKASSSQLPVLGLSKKRKLDKENAPEPEKKRIRGAGTAVTMAISRPRVPTVATMSRVKKQDAAQKAPLKSGPWHTTAVTTDLKSRKPVSACSAPKPVSAVSPTTARKRPSKRPAWDVKGQLCDLRKEFSACQVQTEVLTRENQELKSQLGQAEQQAKTLEAENKVLTAELTETQAQAKEDQLELARLGPRVQELEEHLHTQEALVKSLQEERLRLQEERRDLATRLEVQEVQLQESVAALAKSQAEITAQAALLAERTEHLHGLEMERRYLHNQLQELKGNIRVFCRVRPALPGETEPPPGLILFPPGPNGTSEPSTRLSLTRPPDDHRCSIIGGLPGPPVRYDFSFDRVFLPGCRQHEVFEEVSLLVQSALDGYPVCIFAYGQTGSGKTFTMEGGPGGDPQVEGLIPRAVRHLFSVAKKLEAQGWSYTFVASYVEIYNETIRDLLACVGGAQKCQGANYEIRLAGPGSKELIVTNAQYVPVSCQEEVESLLHLARQNRAVARTAQNEQSSRSHSVFQLQISGKHMGQNLHCAAPLNLVDLAGSERLDPGLSTGPSDQERLKETQAINSSLSALGHVIMALSNKEPHVPYRNSKLTYLLQNSLRGSAKMLMFVNISPLEEHFSESLNSLRFASKVNQCVIGSARANKK
ncbi:kinesin-like protein KIFC1 isoform X2 [Dromiciops gliroides]|nr:kinesin-like protein KIFC1 isoform X2 [Dromiciops gliroides]XP_043819033.1 kinesin-like protein KIFC1 isoform X2 [Dromiciops gliroides]XP_043819034.1 kinesin-like protein KIFC1 isoform X2 [Dromiciops gliroides]XP_043819035.1 kinesin-like protein KIFC1 isoform X2 [Dromiciops gliroides]